ncbi:MAG TPA: hypothetical protein VFZ34_00560 [Blastocatellia bacterium]|nr:hypothetical protein [Blastocatellia bacterium]
MNNPANTSRKHVWFLTLLLLLPGFLVNAAPPQQGKVTGELWVTGTAALNGKAAVNGMTVLSGNRLETGLDGLMSVNLGRIGRIAVQTATDFTLNFRENFISGDLPTGTIVVNIPNGTAVNIKTPNGEVMVPVEQTPAILTVGVSADGTHAFIKREQNQPRAFRPFEPSRQPIGGWVLPFLAVTGVGVASVLAAVVPTPPDVTPFIP